MPPRLSPNRQRSPRHEGPPCARRCPVPQGRAGRAVRRPSTTMERASASPRGSGPGQHGGMSDAIDVRPLGGGTRGSCALAAAGSAHPRRDQRIGKRRAHIGKRPMSLSHVRSRKKLPTITDIDTQGAEKPGTSDHPVQLDREKRAHVDHRYPHHPRLRHRWRTVAVTRPAGVSITTRVSGWGSVGTRPVLDHHAPRSPANAWPHMCSTALHP